MATLTTCRPAINGVAVFSSDEFPSPTFARPRPVGGGGGEHMFEIKGAGGSTWRAGRGNWRIRRRVSA
jgi:hypothetical protein